jgi:hypothetical protein
LLVLVEGVNKVSENRTEERLEFRSRLFFQRRKGRATRFLHSLVVVETHLEELFVGNSFVSSRKGRGGKKGKETHALHRRNKVLLLVLRRRILLDRPTRIPSNSPAGDASDERFRVVEGVDQEAHEDGKVRFDAGDAAWPRER